MTAGSSEKSDRKPQSSNATKQTPTPSLGQRGLAFGVRCFGVICGRSPIFLSYIFADFLAYILVLYTLVHERRVAKKKRGMIRNLRIAYRDKLTPALRRRILVGSSKHLTRLMIDFFRLPYMSKEKFDRCLDSSEVDLLMDAMSEGKGVIGVVGHLGVWEYNGPIASYSGMKAGGIYRPIKHPTIGPLIKSIREHSGQRVFDKIGAIRPVMRALRDGGMIGIAADENVASNSIFLPFLGTMAATTRTPAVVQLATQSPIVVITCMRTGWGKYKARFWGRIDYKDTGDREADHARIMSQVNEAYAKAIMEYPEQWFWGSRRFYNRPEGEVSLPDGLPPQAKS